MTVFVSGPNTHDKGDIKSVTIEKSDGADEMDQLLKALLALAEDQDFLPTSLWWLTSICNTSFRGSSGLHGDLMHMVHLTNLGTKH